METAVFVPAKGWQNEDRVIKILFFQKINSSALARARARVITHHTALTLHIFPTSEWC